MELFFDTWDSPDPANQKQDVRTWTNQVIALMDIDPDLHAPPVLMVSWTSLQFQCVLAKASQKFILFRPDGIPVRARLNVTFSEFLTPDQQAQQTPKFSADLSKVHVVKRGETLNAIAYRYYDDPGIWRPLAIANDLDDPRALLPGQSLRVPSLPFTDPVSGEVVADMARFQQYAPEFRVRIDGSDLPPALARSVSRISFQSGMEGSSRVEVTVANENLRWLDHPLLHTDNGFSLAIRYAPDPFEEVFVGEITGVDAAFPNGGMPTLTVAAHDFLQRMTTGTKNRQFMLNIPTIGEFPLPDPATAALVAGTNLLIPDLDPVGGALSFLTLLAAYAVDPVEARRAVRVQEGESDFDFLRRLAKDNGWELYIDQTRDPQGYRLRFQFLIQDYAPAVTLEWGRSLLEFTPRLTTVGQVAGVAVRFWVASIKTEFVVTLGYDYDRAAFDLQVYPGLPDLATLLGDSTSGQFLTIEPGAASLTPQKLVSELLPRLNNRLTGQGSAVGNLGIRPGRVINLAGLGDQFGGLYRITSATHTLDQSGYRTSFEVRKEVWFGSIPVPKGPGGLLRVQGQAVG